MTRRAKYEPTAFGEFVDALIAHLEPTYGKIDVNVVAQAVTGVDDQAKLSRLRRLWQPEKHPNLAGDDSWSYSVHNPNRESGTPVNMAWYHDQVVGKLLVLANDAEKDGELKRELGLSRDHFEGSHADAANVSNLWSAIVTMAFRGSVPVWLKAVPLTILSPFCRTMCAEYDRSYQQDSGIRHVASDGTQQAVSDLDIRIRSIGKTERERIKRIGRREGWQDVSDDLAQSLAIYATVLMATLFGPEGLSVESQSGPTPPGCGVWSRSIEGFSLSQEYVGEGGRIVGDFPLRFSPRDQLVIGRAPADGQVSASGVGYVTYHADDETPNCVSGIHAGIAPIMDSDEDGVPVGWLLTHLSRTNETAVRHIDSQLTVLSIPNETAELHDGDEIWLAPVRYEDGSRGRSYDEGAVLRFHVTYSYFS